MTYKNRTIGCGKLAILILLVIFILLGCAGYYGGDCVNSVKKEFPQSQIEIVDRSGYRFVVKTKNNEIYYVETMNNFDVNISKKIKLFN